MFTGYSATMNVGAALRATFDPARPCELCVGVASARETAKQQLPAEIERAAEKILLAFHAHAAVVIPPRPAAWPASLACAAPRRREPVPVPPPRA
jgi:hypothetical protein